MATDNLLRRLEGKRTGVQHPFSWGIPQVIEMDQKCTDLEPQGLGMKSEYRLSANVGVTFICNEAEYDRAKEIARANLQRLIYHPMIEEADKAMMAVLAHNREEALKHVASIIDMCTGRYG